MANGLIPNANFQNVADHLAYIWLNKTLLGPSGLPIFTNLSALDNADLTAAAVEDYARKLDQELEAAAWYDTVFSNCLNALQKHVQAAAVTGTAKDVYATLAAYILGEDIRVHEAFNDIHYKVFQAYINRLQVFDQADILLGTIDWTGSGTGTLTDGLTTDKTLTGGNGLRWRIPTGKSVTSSSVTLTLELPDGTTEEKTVTIVGSAGDTGDIGTPASDWYTDLDSIVINSGGANGNQAVIETVCDRDPALLP